MPDDRGVVAPDEAVEAGADALAYPNPVAPQHMTRVRTVLRATAPLIVAANQPQPSKDAAALVERILGDFTTDEGVITTNALPALIVAVEAFMAAQCAAARADERAKALALHKSDGHPNPALAVCHTCYTAWPCPTARALGAGGGTP